jgi:hypothetical protein
MRRIIQTILAGTASIIVVGAIGFQKDGIRRYADENDSKQRAWEGKAPPALVASEWVNSKPLSLAKLKGKVVLLDMWAYW